MENNIRYLIDDRDYEAAWEHLGFWNRETHWKELSITKNTPKNSVATIPILTYAQIPNIFLCPEGTSYTLYDAESNRHIKSLSSLGLDDEVKEQYRENRFVFALCLDNILNFSQNGQMLYQIRFDLPLTENELARVTNFSIISNNNSSIDNNIVDSKSNIIYPTIDVKETREKVTTEIPKTPQTPQASIPEGEPIPFQLVEEKPSFQGGDINQFLKWVRENQIYPEIAKENGIQGRVTVRATINTDGSMTDIMVVRGVDPSLDKEAIRVVSQSPKWKPGKQGGKAVPVTFQIR